MHRAALIVITVLLAPSALALLAPPAASGSPEWIDPALTLAAQERPDDVLTVILGFERVPDLTRLRLAGFAVMGYDHLPVAVAYVPGADVERLLAQPGIYSATIDVPLERYQLPEAPATLPTSVPGNHGGTGDELTRADMARALGVDGAGVGVAVIDLGTSGLHPGLRPRALGGPMVQNVKVLVSPNRVHPAQPAESPVTLYLEDQVDSDMTDGHGTHTAGIAVGHWTEDGLLGGRAPGADLVAIGTGDMLALPWVLGGFEYVMGHHEQYNIRVVSNSWGVEGPYHPANPVNLASKALADEGMLVIFSAGNHGPGIRTMNSYAQAPHVMAIGSSTLSGAIAYTSSRGDPASGKPGPDLVAPGVEIISGRNQWVSGNDVTYRTAWTDSAYIPTEHLHWYRAVSGTSMAAPQVAGIAALVWQADPTLSAAEVRDILVSTARPIVGFEQTAAGPGLVDAHAAVLAAMGEPVPARDFVQPTVVEHDGDDVVYPFHGALLGGPDKTAGAFHPRLPFPVHLPAQKATIDLTWRAVGATVGLKLSLVAPDGVLLREVALDDADGALHLELSSTDLTLHKDPAWSAAYWTPALDLDAGAIEYDLVARVTYDDGALPAITHVPPPPPPPLPPLTPHARIVIDTDADFTTANGVTGGSGTSGDPYIIEGWDISPGTGVAIDIGGEVGTSSYVVLRNLHVHDTNTNCISLTRAEHVTVRNVHFDGCDYALYFAGGSGILVEDNVFEASARGPSFYGSSDVVVRRNLIQEVENNGIIVGQGATQRSAASLNVVLEENTLLGGKADIFLSSPLALGVQVKANRLGEGAYIHLQIAPALAEISETVWLEGVPRYQSAVLTAPHPYLPISTIIDAGSDRASGGNVCFDDARADAAGATVTALAWDFGDGGASTELRPCHTYAAGTYSARLSATLTMPDGSTKVLSDSVLVR